MAGICDEFLHVEHYGAGPLAVIIWKEISSFRFSSAKIFSTVEPKVPALAAAFPLSTGIDTLSNIRITFPFEV